MVRNLKFFSSLCRFNPWHPARFTSISRQHTLSPQPKLVVMKFNSPLFHALFTPETKALSEIFKKYCYELRIAGGAVRDLLMNKQPDDLDFATTATPDEMKDMFNAEGVRMFNRKGEGHGTVTVRINDKQNFEITTLRVDVHTDGRHAEVEFTTNWELDAGRRDLTINAMFLGLDGTLYDYFHGVDDLDKRLVKFVGEPASRIREDYLRILRYFRFYGRIALKPDDHDGKTLEAVEANIDGLGQIAGERLWVELKKLLTGNYAKHLMLRMLSLGIAPFIGLPTQPNIVEFERVCEKSESFKPQAVTLLTALLKNEEEVLNLHARLKFSKYDRDLALFLNNYRTEKYTLKEYKYMIMESKSKLSDVREWVSELFKYQGNRELMEKIENWQPPKFPVNGHMLLEKGFKKDPRLNSVLTQLKKIWIESDCTMTQEELLTHLDMVSKQVIK